MMSAARAGLWTNGLSIILWYSALALVLVLGTSLLVGLVAFQSVYSFTDATATQRLLDGNTAFASFAEERAGDMDRLVGWLAREQALLPSQELDPRFSLGSMLSVSSADFIGVRSPQGVEIVVPSEMAAVVNGPPTKPSGSDTGFRAAEGMLVWQSEALLPDGRTVFAGYLLGDTFASQFRARTSLGLTIFIEGQSIATSMADSAGMPIRSVPYAPEDPANVAARGLESPGAFVIGDTHYRARYFPFYSNTGRLIGAYSLSLPFPGLWMNGFSVSQSSYLFLFSLLLIAVVAANLFAKRVIRPLRTLRSAIARMSNGDLATPILTKASAEVQPLASQMEEMRRTLLSAHTQLAIEKSLYQGIFQSMADGVFTTNEEGEVTSANPAMLAAGHWVTAQGSECCGIYALKDSEGRSMCDHACLWLWLRGQSEPIVVKGYREDGAQRRDIEVTVTPIKDQSERTVGLVHVLRDISAQEELQRLKERFLLSVSHELRTPLSALATSVELLKDKFEAIGPEKRTRILETTQRSIVRLQGLIANMLDLGSIQAGRFSVSPRYVPLQEPLQEAISVSEVILNSKGQRIQVIAPAEMPAVVADPVRVVQALTNLIANASKYGPAEDTIVITVDDQKDQARIEVTDHGPGIAPEEKQRVFEYFFRGQEAVRSEKGFGLGLAMVKGIVEAHKGHVGITSELGGGTSIWFTLPKQSLLRREGA